MMRVVARYSFVFSLIAVATSVGSFAALEVQSDSWEAAGLHRFGYVLIALAVAVALLVERYSSGGASELSGAARVQLVAGLVALGFVVVAIIKLYTYTSSGISQFQAYRWIDESSAIALAALAFGLVGTRTRRDVAKYAVILAGLAAVGASCYAFSLEIDDRSLFWFLFAATMGFLATAAATRVRPNLET